MMKFEILFCTTLLATAPMSFAQEGAAAFEMPNPKQEQHTVLEALTGTWELVMKSEAMPGVPGMEKASESKGIERAELICNGLWLKSVIEGEHNGEPFQGVWLVGYDPFAKRYTGVWAGSDVEECGACTMAGTYDDAARTWTWAGTTWQGEMRSVFVLDGADRSVETCYMKTADGKEVKCMEITRKRAKSALPVEASAVAVGDLPDEYAVLHEDVGTGAATVEMTMPGQPASEEKCTERVSTICHGRWLWSDFRGQMMGAPYEGHALVGYDPTQKKYVSYWIDSTSATIGKTAGTYDAEKRAFTLAGTSTDPMGNPLQVKEVLTWKDADTRELQMEFKGKDGTYTMKITYAR